MFRFFCMIGTALLLASPALATPIAPDQPDPEFDAILARDIAELTVTSVSKRPQQRSDTAAAVYVITQDDLRRTGVTSVPEALRLVPGLEVARASAHRWAITSRGFNNVIASKLLVLIDGRIIYTPVFSGTYWDDQTVLLEDIDRIEVIRGPGASLYGANAVNGIINIITRHSADTQGKLASAALGNEEGRIAARQGGRTAENSTYRTYAQYHAYDATKRLSGGPNQDKWRQGRAGFRLDSPISEQKDYTIQGDAYASRYDTEAFRFLPVSPFFIVEQDNKSSYGANLMGRWNYALDNDSALNLQTSLDHYGRAEIVFDQRVTTADARFQHTVTPNARHNFMWGGGVRYNLQRLDSTFSNGVVDENVNRAVFDLFVQDEYALLPEELYLTLGSKFEHNDYTGFEIQPSARLSWQPADYQTLWAAVSRAVRTPSEIEDQAFAVVAVVPGAPPLSYAITGSTSLDAEELFAYELGYRIQPLPSLSFDITAFYNDYDELGTINTFSTPVMRQGTLMTPLPFSNLGTGDTYGMEIATDWNVTQKWRLSGSYSYLQINVDFKLPAAALVFDEDSSPQHKFAVQSYYNLTDTLQWNNMLYYTSEILSPADAYLRYDSVLTWQATPQLELSVIGRNLLDSRHAEFPYNPQAEIEQSVLGMVTWRF